MPLACALFAMVSMVNAQEGMRAEDHLRLADEFYERAKPDDAIAHYEQAVAAFQAPGDSGKVIHALNQMGVILTRQDQYERARMYLDRALALGLSSPGTDELLVASTYLALGVVYSAQNEFDRSLDVHNKALELRRTRLGEFDANVATSYGNIGNVHFRKREYDLAIEAHSRAMQIRAKVFGTQGPQIVESYRGLGNAYREKKDYVRALEFFQKALDNKLAQLGAGHRDLGRFYRYLSEVHGLAGNATLAEECRIKAEEVERPGG